ncbi:DUF4156 domain-containing protein [Pseudoxanthomonas taiwanensis]|jgi:hypothetical protein|uniref:DUF4156 domain-containing protein n=1 Tax=Pseudoxanthomonas taiwanensis TaxID=176598 RepID=A0A921NVD7_9GAMM|nr:DUF4156 domain-containing protein [Pseudoxanthomonas taiwanensis]KAF1688751.1 hypothetical protein CR938_08555 [Pseudoxanthomonas taiwanensis]MBO2466679.1 DUF4156 domain-containing protein [Xanthomonadaceae bacterium]
MPLRRLSLLSVLALSLSACTWVPIQPQAKAVRVLPAGAAPAGCTKQGEVEVSVKHAVGFYRRNPVKVRDELETLARNEAPGVGANAVQPLAEPVGGSQRFAAWRCP